MVFSIAAVTTTALASDDKEKNTAVGVKAENGIEVQLGGTIDVQYGNVSQKKALTNPVKIQGLAVPGSKNDIDKLAAAGKFKEKADRGIVNNTKLKFSIKKKDVGCNLEYGGVIELNADVSQSSTFNKNPATKTVIYTQGEFGRAEVGSYDGAGDKLKVSAIGIAKATGGVDGDWSLWVPFKAYSKQYKLVMNQLFLTDPYLPYSTDHAKKSNKATYYTPDLNGFTFGVSYIPDVDVKGSVAELIRFRTGGYKNVIDSGIKYKKKFDNGFDLAGSAIVEFGKAKNITFDSVSAYDPSLKAGSILKRKNLRSWELGGQLGYKGFTLAGSYGDWGKSGSVRKVYDANGGVKPLVAMAKKNATFWTLGTSYAIDKFGASLTYMDSRRGSGSVSMLYDYLATSGSGANGYQKMNAVSFGLEYQVMPGLLPYAEYTSFRYKTSLDDISPNNGHVALAGVKISF